MCNVAQVGVNLRVGHSSKKLSFFVTERPVQPWALGVGLGDDYRDSNTRQVFQIDNHMRSPFLPWGRNKARSAS